MDFTELKDVIGWILGFSATSVIALVVGVINIIKSGKMMPREIKGVDLENDEKNLTNEEKRLGLAASYKAIAKQAADEALETNKRLTSLEEKVETQETIIKQQAEIITKQSKRLDLQDIKIKEQEDEIALLRCELSNANSYNAALIQQMKDAQLIPIEVSLTNQIDCSEVKKQRRSKGQKNGNKME